DDDDDNDTDDEDEEPFEDEDDDEEEEHLASADSSAIPVVDLVPSARDTEAFETDQAEVKRLLALPFPPPSPLSPWSSPLPQIPSSPLPPPPSSLHLPPPVPTSLPLPSSPLPPLPASLFIPPPINHREDILEAELPPCKRSHRANYGFIDTMDAEIRRQRAEEDGQDRQTQLSKRVDVLIEDSQFHHEIARQFGSEGSSLIGLTPMQDLPYHFIRSPMTATMDCSGFIAPGTVCIALGQIQALQLEIRRNADYPEALLAPNNMPPRRTSASTVRAVVVATRAAAAAPMTAAIVEQLIEARVSATLPNHETL
ncbi:hypothetical protein Tco_0389624, partial [Tanacetum coccineum]